MTTRREFGAALLAMAVPRPVGASPDLGPQRSQKNGLMHVGADYHGVAGGDITARQNLEYVVRHGVKHLTVQLAKRGVVGWRPDELRRMRDACDRYGVVLEAIRMDSDYIRLRTRPARDREVDTIIITYFLERVIPAAKEYDVRMACHPYDPPGLPFGYQAVDQWDSPVVFEAIKRYEAVADTPYPASSWTWVQRRRG
jgi:hypothetical protein